MSDALALGAVETICVGEPWVSYAVARGAGTLIPAGRAIRASPLERGMVRDLPDASARIEGSLAQTTVVSTEEGQMIPGADTFLDGETYDTAFAER